MFVSYTWRFQFQYGNADEPWNVVAVQLKLLRVLSTASHQNVTYHCRNSVAYRDEASGALKKALILRGSNGQDLRAQGNGRLRYTVLEDGCSVRPWLWHGGRGCLSVCSKFVCMHILAQKSITPQFF